MSKKNRNTQATELEPITEAQPEVLTAEPATAELPAAVVAQAQKILAKQEASKAKRIEHIRNTYPHADADTLEFDPVANKWSCEIRCQYVDPQTGEMCGKRRRVFTSDLFQVRMCEEHSKLEKAAKRSAKQDLLKKAMQAIKEGKIAK